MSIDWFVDLPTPRQLREGANRRTLGKLYGAIPIIEATAELPGPWFVVQGPGDWELRIWIVTPQGTTEQRVTMSWREEI